MLRSLIVLLVIWLSLSAQVSAEKFDSRMASFDRMMEAFMKRHSVPGAALAVTDQGRLVYARGFGYGDVAAEQKVEPTSLFRIASISKPITAVAILQLVEQGRLGLHDKVFDVLNWPKLAEGNDSFDKRLKAVTIHDLLEHRGGWDRGASFDPMFQSVRLAEAQDVPPPAGPDAIIRCMFRQRLDYDPGGRYVYSNYGYCLLGRVIENVTGQTYEAYVKKHVLLPLGITAMSIGGTRLEQRGDHEVRYYDPAVGPSVFAEDLDEPVPSTYGAWYLEAMDAHGGWVASAVDLARFASAFDDPENCKILNGESVRAMYARPDGVAGYEDDGKPKAVFYSCGWQNRVAVGDKFNHWHSGSLPGTSTLLVRRWDGRNWAILLNARTSPNAKRLSTAIDPLLHRAAAEVREWPEEDLFQRNRSR